VSPAPAAAAKCTVSHTTCPKHRHSKVWKIQSALNLTFPFAVYTRCGRLTQAWACWRFNRKEAGAARPLSVGSFGGSAPARAPTSRRGPDPERTRALCSRSTMTLYLVHVLLLFLLNLSHPVGVAAAIKTETINVGYVGLVGATPTVFVLRLELPWTDWRWSESEVGPSYGPSNRDSVCMRGCGRAIRLRPPPLLPHSHPRPRPHPGGVLVPMQ